MIVEEVSISYLDTFKKEIFEEIKNVKYKDLEDMVSRMGLLPSKLIAINDINSSGTSNAEYILPSGMLKISRLNYMLETLFHSEVKANVTINDIIKISNLFTTNLLENLFIAQY